MQSRNYNAANTNNATLVQAGPTSLGTLTVYNAGGAAAYLKLYDKASAPAPASDVPVMVIAVPTVSTAHLPFAENPFRFKNGLAFVMVTGAGDTDNTSVAANQLKATFVTGQY